MRKRIHHITKTANKCPLLNEYRVRDMTIIWGGRKYDNTMKDLRWLHTVRPRRLPQHRKRTSRRTPVTYNSGADIRDKSLSPSHGFQCPVAEAVKKQTKWIWKVNMESTSYWNRSKFHQASEAQLTIEWLRGAKRAVISNSSKLQGVKHTGSCENENKVKR